MGAIASQITSPTIFYSTIYSDADQRKQQSSASLAFVRGIHRGPVKSLHKWPVTREMFPFDDVVMYQSGTKPKLAAKIFLYQTDSEADWTTLQLCWQGQLHGYVMYRFDIDWLSSQNNSSKNYNHV